MEKTETSPSSVDARTRYILSTEVVSGLKVTAFGTTRVRFLKFKICRTILLSNMETASLSDPEQTRCPGGK